MKILTYRAYMQDIDGATSYIKERKKSIKNDFFDKSISALNVFTFGQELYMYVESLYDEVKPDDMFPNLSKYLLSYPLGSFYEPMTCVFHFNKPVSNEEWKRKTKPDKCYAMVAEFKPDLVSRYVFYHYQLQEEKPGCGDKYGKVYISGTRALYYGEEPFVIEKPSYKGTLDTSNTPNDDEWQGICETHFVMWDENKHSEKITGQWLHIENILSLV